jgi:hypothetical protein
LTRPRLWGDQPGRRQKDPPRKAVAHLYAPDRATFHFVEKAQEAKDLVTHHEVCQCEFWSWLLILIQFHVLKNHRQRVEYGFGACDLEVFDVAVVYGLAKPHKDLAGIGELLESQDPLIRWCCPGVPLSPVHVEMHLVRSWQQKGRPDWSCWYQCPPRCALCAIDVTGFGINRLCSPSLTGSGGEALSKRNEGFDPLDA